MKALIFALALLTTPLFGNTVKVSAQPEVLFRLNLVEVTQLKGPFAWVAGPEWLSLTAAGTLSGTPAESDLGQHTLQFEAKSGQVWMPFEITLDVRYPRYTLQIFAAPWCTSCAQRLPEISRLLSKQSSKELSRLDTRVLVETDEDPAEPPTDAGVKTFSQSLNVPFAFEADPWRWQTYRRHFPSGFRLPAAVLLDESGQAVKRFSPEEALPSNIYAYVHHYLTFGHLGQKRDVLFVGDNSGSMSLHQNALAQALPNWLDELRAGGRDWRLGLVSTDLVDAPFLGFASPLGLVDPSSKDLFLAAWGRLGASGSGIESPFGVVLKHLNANPGFLRPDAGLAILWVTDEDDQTVAPGPTNPLMNEADYLSALGAHKPSLTQVRHFGIIGTQDMGCTSSGSNQPFQGSRLQKVMKATGGSVQPLCGAPLGESLKRLGTAIELF